ncbi:DUF1653 domain-containing protein [Candidatus Uhrbacteria bacterium]|nr:DUF1653 domain-containing protein [Candidatus Uhrbacteria bacterium]
METAIQIGTYRHYSGKAYKVIGIGKHSETLEDMVIYEALYDNQLSKIWIRPVAMFTEIVPWPDGNSRPRFEFIG